MDLKISLRFDTLTYVYIHVCIYNTERYLCGLGSNLGVLRFSGLDFGDQSLALECALGLGPVLR